MGKDLLSDRYGRFYEIPYELARMGHDILGVSLSYVPNDEGEHPVANNQQPYMTWHSYNLKRLFMPGSMNLFMPGSMNYFHKVKALARKFKPEIIYACSDSFHAIIGQVLSRKLNIPYVVDLYDNFESYPATRLPGVFSLFKQAVKGAGGVTCISDALKKHLENEYIPKGQIITVENAVTKDLFHKMDKALCRKQFGLPAEGKIIGTAGALHRNRGIEDLFTGFEKLAEMNTNYHLAIAGRLDSKIHVHYLGELPYEEIPYLINAFDVGVICNRDSAFGRYCFPQKAYEMMACEVPVVASAVGAMKELFADYPACMFEPGNSESLCEAVEQQLEKPCLPDINVLQWSELAKRLEHFFSKVTTANL
jgi:glycosyltransferase involved in cell wall biosynthesis